MAEAKDIPGNYQHHSEIKDDRFLKSFENLTLEPVLFCHEAHIRLGWLYLSGAANFEQALGKISKGIRGFDTEFSSEIKYHHTITVAFASIIHNRMKTGQASCWQEFIHQNNDLLNSKSILLTHYSEEILNSPLAKIKFIEPDKQSF